MKNLKHKIELQNVELLNLDFFLDCELHIYQLDPFLIKRNIHYFFSLLETIKSIQKAIDKISYSEIKQYKLNFKLNEIAVLHSIILKRKFSTQNQLLITKFDKYI